MWGLQETMAILGTSQPSSTPPHLYPFGMPQGGSVKHSLHHCDSDLPQIPSGLFGCTIPYNTLPMVFSQGLADSTALQLPSHITEGWTHIPKYTANSGKNICRRGSEDIVACITQSNLQSCSLCPSIPCSNIHRAFKDKSLETSLNFRHGYTVNASASNQTPQTSTCSKLQHLLLEPLFSQKGQEFKSILIQSRAVCQLVPSPPPSHIILLSLLCIIYYYFISLIRGMKFQDLKYVLVMLEKASKTFNRKCFAACRRQHGHSCSIPSIACSFCTTRWH